MDKKTTEVEIKLVEDLDEATFKRMDYMSKENHLTPSELAPLLRSEHAAVMRIEISDYILRYQRVLKSMRDGMSPLESFRLKITSISHNCVFILAGRSRVDGAVIKTVLDTAETAIEEFGLMLDAVIQSMNEEDRDEFRRVDE